MKGSGYPLQLWWTAARIVFTVVCVLQVDVDGAYGPVLSSSEKVASNSGKRGILVGRTAGGPFGRSTWMDPLDFEFFTVQNGGDGWPFAEADFFLDRPKYRREGGSDFRDRDDEGGASR